MTPTEAIQAVFARHRASHEAQCRQNNYTEGMGGGSRTYSTDECPICHGPLEEEVIAAVVSTSG